MRAREILEQVRYLIGDPSYSGYFDLNRAHRFICASSKHRFTRQSRTGVVFFDSTTSSYSLNLADVDEIEALYIRGGSGGGSWVQPVQSKAQASPPSSAVLGHRYIVATSPGGLWAAYTPGHIATATTADGNGAVTAWTQSEQTTGDVALVVDEDLYYTYDSTAASWTVVTQSTSGWEALVDVSAREFEHMQGSLVTSTGVTNQSRPRYYTWTGGATGSLRIYPRPDQSYDTKLSYVARPQDLTDSAYPLIPPAFQDMLVNLTAGYALQRSTDSATIFRGDRLVGEAMKWVSSLNDFSNRTTQSVDRTPRPFLR